MEPPRQQTTPPPSDLRQSHHLTGPSPGSLRVDAGANVYPSMYKKGSFASARSTPTATDQATSASWPSAVWLGGQAIALARLANISIKCGHPAPRRKWA